MPKLAKLESRLGSLGSRVSALSGQTYDGSTRLRGRAAVERRRRWLTKHPLCEHCKAEGVIRAGLEVDDIVPLWKGGVNEESNFQTLCDDHHKAKTAREAKERAELGLPTGGRF